MGDSSGGIGLRSWEHVRWVDTMECFLFHPNTDLSVVDSQENTEELLLIEKRNHIEKYEKGSESERWEYYKKCANPYEFVFTSFNRNRKNNLPESICRLKPLSRSYFKMTEILEIVFNKYPSFYKKPRCFLNSAHVCEGPGGFIEGFIDFSRKMSYRPGCSRAITLCSMDYNVPGWKKANRFLQKNRSVKISYGEDGTGNILVYENQNNFIRECFPKADIFTGDGGFDFSSDYTSQESSIFPLLVSTVRIGLECLHEGGVFIMKIFDFYQQSTVDLLYFLSVHFKHWTIYKPAMSRPNNPESYFIGVDFIGCRERNLSCIRNWSMCVCNKPYNFRNIKLYNDLSVPFMNYISNMRSWLFKLQIYYLNKTFSIVEKPFSELNDIISDGIKNSTELCKVFKLPTASL